MTDYEKTWAQQAQMQQGGVNALNQFNTSAPISEIEIFKQVWPWIDGYSGMLMRKRNDPDLPKSAKDEILRVCDSITQFARDVSCRFPKEVRQIVLENRDP